jgi:beta-N-acetylhexosaminidase
MNKLITTLTDEQLAGQRLMVGFEGTTFNDDLKHLIGTLCVGGVILFSRNIESPEQLSDLCQSIQNYAREIGHTSLLISIDQEGGVVARLKPPFTTFPGNPAIGKDNSDQGAIDFAEITARELREVGINMDLAPVVDVAPAGFDSVMKDRIFSNDPGRVGHLGAVVIRHLQNNKIAACAKHFPGIGHTTLDSHLDLPYLGKERDELDTFDLVPFRAAIAAGVRSVMLSHVVYASIDPEWPASLSKKVASDLLRGEMGFQEVILTDDLDMGAIARHYDIVTITNQILDGDIDIILLCHTLSKMESAYEQVLADIKNSPEGKERNIESVKRILRLKENCINEKHSE